MAPGKQWKHKAMTKADLKKWQTKHELERKTLSQMVKPHYVVAYSWGRAQNRDPWSIKGKMSFHGLYGYRKKVEGYKLARYTLSGDGDLKFRMMNFWENCKTNKIKCPIKRYRKHNVKLWRDEYYKHVVALQMDQAQFEATAWHLFDKFENAIDGMVKFSSSFCYGTTGSRLFNVCKFLREANSNDIFPTVHIKDANIEVPGEQSELPRATKKVLEEVRMYVDMDLEPIQSPFHAEGTVQGNYTSLANEIFLV